MPVLVSLRDAVYPGWIRTVMVVMVYATAIKYATTMEIAVKI